MYNLWYFVAFYTVLLQNLFFLAIYAVLLQNRFLRFTRYCVEKNLAKNSARGEKMTNMRYGSDPSSKLRVEKVWEHVLERGQILSEIRDCYERIW